MNLISLLFRLLAKFVPFDEGEYAKLNGEAANWYASIRTDDEKDVPKEKRTNPILKTAKTHAEKWYTKVFCAIAYIYLFRVINEWMHPTRKDNDTDEDDQ